MRRLAFAGFAALFALPAFAQDAGTTIQINSPPPAAATPAYVPVGTPVATVPAANGTVVVSPTNATANSSGAAPLEDIGFDPKVKRDPNGRIINTIGSGPAPITDRNVLRVDNATSLRSDVVKPQIQQPIAPKVAPVTISKPTGAGAAASVGTNVNGTPVTP